MGKILVTLGGVVVVILFAALVAPYFIDWNHYKNEIESRSAMFFGRPVHIDGEISVRLLPQPVLRIHGVRIDGAGGEALLVAKAIEARLAIEPLLKRNIEITHIELVKPVLTLIREEGGRHNWKPGAGKTSGLANTEKVSVQNLHIQNGRIVYRDKMRDVEKSIERIDADLNAMSLRGPFKISGTFGDRASVFKIATNRLGRANDLRLTGRITGGFGDGRLSGSFQNVFDDVSFQGKLDFRAEKNRDNRIFVSTETRITLAASVLKFLDIKGTIGEGGAAMRYQGVLSLDWKDIPRIEGRFSARRADLDGLLGKTGRQMNKAGWLKALPRSVPLSLPEELVGSIDLKIDGGLLGGKSFSNLDLQLVSDGRNLSIAVLKVMLPGQSGLDVSGKFEGDGQAPVFKGAFKLDTPDLSQFLNWVGYEGAFAPKRGALQFQLSSKISLSSQKLELADGAGKLGGEKFNGYFAYDTGKSKWTLRAWIDALDLDRYFKGAKGNPKSAALNFSLMRPSKWARRFPALLSGESDLSLNIGALTQGGKTYKWFTGNLRFNNGDLAIHKIAYTSDPGENVNLSGNIANLRTKPQTYLQIKLVAPSMANAFPAGVLRELPELETGLGGLGTADLDLLFTGFESAKEVRLSLRGSGKLSNSKVQIEAEFTGAPERLSDGQISWRLRLENDSAKNLLDQLHIPEAGAPWGGGGLKSIFEWEGKGAINLLLPFSASLHLPGAKFSLKGTLEKDKTYRFSDARLSLTVEDSARLEARLTGRAIRQAKAIPVTLTATLDGGRGDLIIAGASGAAGGAPFTAHGRMKLDGDKPEITLNLKPERFDLSMLLANLFDVDADGNDGQGAPEWSSSVFDTTHLHSFSLNLDIETPQLAINNNLILKQAALSLRTGAGVFDVQTLSGTLMGASMLASVRLEDDGNGILKGQSGLVLDGLSIKDVLKGVGGREVLKGVMSIKADLQLSGRSLAGLVSSLRGSGDIQMTGAQIIIPDLFASALIAGAAQNAGELEKAMKNSIGWRLTSYAPGPARTKISNGILRIENVPFTVDGRKGAFNALGDLSARKLDARWTFPLPDLKNAPPLGVIYSGPYTGLEKRVDFAALMRFITRKRIEREAEDSRNRAIGPKKGAPPTGLIRQNITDLPSLTGAAAQ